MRKFLCMLTLFAAVFALTLSAAEIGTADDFLKLMQGQLSWDADYTLTADIELPADGQAPIGNTETPYTGTFDGAGHTVSGLNLTEGDGTVCGLFGKVDSATVKNLTVEGTVNATATYVGGIIGMAENSTTILNCTSRVNVTNNSEKSSDYLQNGTGGIVGRMYVPGASSTVYETGIIENCKNEGTVSGAFEVGGIAGLFGGITAYPYGMTTVSGCLNSGNVTSTGGRVAGIIGYYVICGTLRATVCDCANTGSIYTGSTVAAGIIGAGNLSNKKYTVTRCFNSGSVTSGSSSATFIHPIMGAAAAVTVSSELISYCYYSSTDTYTSNETTPFETYVSLDAVETSCTSLGDKWIVVNGYAPELAVFHNHTLGDYVTTSAAGHYKTCYCGYTTETEAHTYENSLCTVCGASSCAHGGDKTYKNTKTAATCVLGGVDIYTCLVCQNDFEVATEPDADNHSGSVVLSATDGAANYVCSDCGHTHVSRTERDVYVAASGVTAFTAENVSTVGNSTAPFGNFTDAMAHAAAIATSGVSVNVYITDSATIPTDYVTEKFDGHITVSGGTLYTGNRFVVNGDTTIENITVTPSTALVIVAHCNNLTLGEGIVMGNTKEVYVIGGYDSRLSTSGDVPKTGFASNITIRSGTYAYVVGGNRNLTCDYSGTVDLTIGKTNENDTLKITKRLIGTSYGGDHTYGVHVTFIFDGDVDFCSSGAFNPFSSNDVDGGYASADIVLYGKLLNLDGTVFRGPDYTVDVYADTTVSGMEEVIADLAEGEMQMHPIEEYKNTVAEPCEAHTYEAIAAGSITTNTCTACGDVVKTTSAARLDKAVQTYVFGDVRITVLSDSVVRVEQAADGEFVDAATLIVPFARRV